MKPKFTRALGVTILLCATFGAHAAPDDDIAPYGKRLTSTEALAQSRPGSFDVYIDEPTGFAFVHTPEGWKFTRKVQDDSPALAGWVVPDSCEMLRSAALTQR
jgi:hypothetical protein